MRRAVVVGLLLTSVTMLSISGCAASNSTAELSVTYTDETGQTTRQVSLTDLSCRTSSAARFISSEAVNSSGKEIFLAMAPTDGRESYPLSVWFDDFVFTSSTEAKFDASGDTVVFDALPGFIEESLDGSYASSAGYEATLNGTINCTSW